MFEGLAIKKTLVATPEVRIKLLAELAEEFQTGCFVGPNCSLDSLIPILEGSL